MAVDTINKVLEEILFFSVVRWNPSSWEPGLSYSKGVLDLKNWSGLDILQESVSFIRAFLAS